MDGSFEMPSSPEPESNRGWFEEYAGAEIGVILPEGDKHTMIGFTTKNENAFRLFNDAAEAATKPYGGFNQVNSEEDGVTRWELWKLGETDPNVVIESICDEAKKIKDLEDSLG